jgi:GalNAc-alpha-(1->4)-GalNAc-alpha-(1->3)-diNAcBac-PP-undecaprenol alpha-1,4-N-acetyl-D-galactosaminyltransferase
MLQRLTLVIHALHGGGAERVLAVLASHWAASGRQVTLVTLDDQCSDEYPLHPEVSRVGLGGLRVSRSPWGAVIANFRRCRQLRSVIAASRPELVISFTDRMNVLTLLASARAPWPVLIAERSDPRRQRMPRVWEWLRRWTYPRCAAAVVQTETVASCVRELVGRRPVFTIPNAAFPSPVDDDQENLPGRRRPYLVALGRLSPEKGFDLLIEAFARIADRHPDVDMKIIGEGPCRTALEAQAASLGVTDRVELAGWVAQPAPALQHGLLFVLPSRWEGFPNALLEAMASGLPAVGSASNSGTDQIIRHEVDGLLVPPEDVEALAAGIDRLLSHPELRQQMSSRAREVIQRFEAKNFFDRWDHVVASLVKHLAG